MQMKEISAGGVVFRRVDGALQIQLIQDRYGKISLPKGKMEPGETVEQTALREIPKRPEWKALLLRRSTKLNTDTTMKPKG